MVVEKLKFVEGVRPDVTADIVLMMCPMHLLTVEQKMKELKVGEVLEILTDYDGALEDIPAWCEKTGNEFIGIEDASNFFRMYVRKLSESHPDGKE